MTSSPTIAALAAALTKAQSAMTGAKKDSTNPHFRSAYADLASIWDACRAPLANAQLSIIQLTSSDAGHAIIETVLAHSSGEWISSTLSVPMSKTDAQGLGSAITYGRRYALAAIIGIAPEDDDGEAAIARHTQKRQQEPPDDVPMRHVGDPERAEEAIARKNFEQQSRTRTEPKTLNDL